MSITLTTITAIMILLLSIFDALISIGNWSLTVIFSCIAYFNYSILVANYLWSGNDMLLSSLANDPVSKIGINILLLFMVVVTLFLPKKINKNKNEKNYFINNENKNNLLTLGIAVVLVLILIYGFTRPDLAGVRGTPSPLYEYSLIFFIIGFYFSGNKKLNISILSLILILFVLQEFLYGGRVTGLQLVICWFIMLYSYKTNIRQILPILIVVFIFLSLIGAYRAELNLSVRAIQDVLVSLVKGKLSLDTAYSAYYTSLTFIKVEGFSSVATRLDLFGKFILAMFLGGNKVADSSLAEYTKQYYEHYYGGVLPLYFHFYLGWFGVILSAIIVSLYCRLINKIDSESKGLIKCVGLFLVCHVFRWYLYSPSGLFRGVGLTVIAYCIAIVIDNIMKKKKLIHI